ncbi:MAG: FAD-dependent thymidylate synthase [Candidatus Villigracilaceae bacterium]
MPSRQIYLLSAREFSPETIAVAFAKTSRSPQSFRQIAAELSEEKSARFHERWVVGYGHASVAEHAVLHIAFENISRVAIECIESNRLASYTEKSTRYQKWGSDDFAVPPELEGHPLHSAYLKSVRHLFQAYTDSLAAVREVVMRQTSRRPDEDEETFERRIRSSYVDACRFLLPAAALANVGMTANARVLENAIRKMLSHPLAEVHQIGEEVKSITGLEAPTLVKYANETAYLKETPALLTAENSGHHPSPDWCTLIDYDHDGEKKVLAAALYRFSGLPYAQALATVQTYPRPALVKLAESLLGRLGEHDIPLRELEYCTYTFELVMDQGAYAEFKRHRMMTQTPQALTTRLGYATPRLITEAGFRSRYEAAMETAAEMYEKLFAYHPLVAQYIVPNACYRRVLAQFNLREAWHFCQLRAAPNAHFSIRRVAQRVYEQIAQVHPLLARYMRLPAESWQEIQARHFD